jgi:hypothetical protein
VEWGELSAGMRKDLVAGSLRGKDGTVRLVDLREWIKGGRIVKWVRVKSRMLTAVALNHDWHHLYLEFRSGDIYCYRGVPIERYEEILAADSKG